MLRKLTEHKGALLSYGISGSDGPVLVLLHGFGEDSGIWARQQELAAHCRLLLPDLPGSGRSAPTGDLSMEGMADAVAAMLDAEGISRCILVGHSMGGYVALAFGERYPGRLQGLGLFHSTAYADTEEKRETRRKGIAFIEKNGGTAFLRASTPNLYSEESRTRRPELVAAHLSGTLPVADATLTAYYRSMIERPDRSAMLKDAKIPVLFLLGRHDNAVPLKDGLAQCVLPDRGMVFLMNEAGHMGMVECPEAANDQLLTYLRFVNQWTAAQ
ncbi:alpha/beta hydrolase [Flaviaesturariibacter amylovorans]|uniref:Alpha/beta hydrolase n=1 Tax=Flaviaesturariibacter amylovorans TaxID=1084520 RepID=A0ABP8G8N6_9BACT